MVISAAFSPVFAQTPGIYWSEQHSEHPAWGDPTPERWIWRTPLRDPSGRQALTPGHAAIENVEHGLTVDSVNGKVYYFTRHFGTGVTRLIERNLDGSSPRNVLQCGGLSPAPPCTYAPQSLKFDAASGDVIIFAGNGIYRVDPSAATPVATAVYHDPSIFILHGDIDTVNGDFVFLEFLSSHYRAIKLDGSNLRILGATCPQHRCTRTMAVDGTAGRIYYSKYGAGDLYQVFSQNFDGSDNVPMYGPWSPQSQHGVNDLAIDFSTRTLYIAHGREGFGHGIDMAALHGDAPFHRVNFYNAALSSTPQFISLGTMVPGTGPADPPPGPITPADSTPPAMTVSVAGTLGANGWYTSTVGVTWSVSDPDSPVSSSTGCDAAGVTADTAGVTFTCSATSAGGTATQSVTVKRDATAPSMTLPANISTVAASAAGSVVTYSAPATDATSGVSISACVPPSGSTFAPGTTTVSCSATDFAGNTSGGSFQVTVKGAGDLLADLAAMVNGVGPGNSLSAKVGTARSRFAAGNNAGCADALRALLNEVRAQTGKKITAAQSAAITALTDQILALL